MQMPHRPRIRESVGRDVAMTELPTIDELSEALRDGLLAGSGPMAESNQGEVHRVRYGGADLVVKQPRGAGPLGWVNRWGLKREYAAYRRLAGLRGVPRCLGLVDGRWLVLEHVDGVPYREARPGDEFHEALGRVLAEMHERGVAHGDLKRKANLLVKRDGQPVLLDFGAAVVRRPGFHPLNRRLFELLRQTDRNAWIKLKYGGYGGLSEADRQVYRPSRIERLLRRLRRR